MSVVPIPWQPLGARDLAAGSVWITRAIATWQKTWFAMPALAVEAVELIDPFDAVSQSRKCESWSCGEDVWLFAEPGQIAVLVNEALDLPKTFAPTDDAHAALLAQVGTQLVGELLEAIGAARSPAQQAAVPARATQGADAPTLRYGGASFRLLNASGETVSMLICGASTLWSCSPVNKPAVTAANTRTSSPRSAAVEASRVSVYAMLGQCELSVPQLATLTVGDVIRLDHAITDPIPLLLANGERERRTPIATGTPGQHAGKFSIQLTSIARPDTP